MPTVVGTDDSAKKRITCQSCASIVEYVPKDVGTLWGLYRLYKPTQFFNLPDVRR